MTTEEKAEAYDKAIEKIKYVMEHGVSPVLNKEDLQDIFYELKESEDESMRKLTIQHLDRAYQNCVFDEYKNEIEKCIAWLEKQGEQKPIDKVEPKFKVGDWIIFNEHHNSIYQVERIDNYRFYLRHYLGGTLSVHFDNELIRQWTIADAKDGDVLSDGTTIFIFKDLLSDGSVMSYCDCDTDSDEGDAFCPSVSLMCSKITPATEEQCELLFQKMYEVGYKWDAEKKELKRFEKQVQVKETTITCRDEKIRKALINFFNDSYCHDGEISENCEVTVNDALIWLEKQGREKPKWTLRDEELYQDTLDAFEALANDLNPSEDWGKLYDWIKSLKQRKEEQQ